MDNVVLGVIDSEPGGAGGDDGWTFSVHLMPWIDAAGRLGELPLRVEIDMSLRKIKKEMKRLATGMTVQVHTAPVDGPQHASWQRVRGTSPLRVVEPTAALISARAERERPVVIEDGVLGRLVLDRSFGCYKGRAMLWGQPCRVAVDRSGAIDDRERDLREVALAAARFAEVGSTRAAIERAISDAMLPLYNDTWRETRQRLSSSELLACLKIDSISLSTRRTTICFEDGGLFYDHAIIVGITPEGGVFDVSLAG